ncbi:hypothetical protein BDM02DRAFT_3185464 [Thelephora ganbajun]|uniref:Uncharacterized protein n=1 Tax=Thelephora ganbajun TaxID=370292 RepID=A0ACB6ZMQ4_THEGA|nr:hypothetical protein BDM02DRAFT_3185464 [Thelephora ganbajun]
MPKKWPSPLEDYQGPRDPLPTEFNPDGRSLKNTPGLRSSVWDQAPKSFLPNHANFDFHIYYNRSNEDETKFARELHERLRREFPELMICRFREEPIGPHPVAMFEVDTFTPHETGTLFTWLAVNRGPLSVLVHPNTGDHLRDHSILASWMGTPWPLKLYLFEKSD